MKTKSPTIKRIKAAVTVDQVLSSYGVTARAGATGRVAACPIHGASKASRAFRVSKDRCAWYCFGCDQGGSVIDLVMAIEDCDVPRAAKILAERFHVT